MLGRRPRPVKRGPRGRRHFRNIEEADRTGAVAAWPERSHS
jgi:hypothetical protein